jgi:amino acid adenylation domain-containing protein
MMTRGEHGAPPEIAIVGMSGRFPGAPDVATFWQNLCAGVESIAHFSADDLEDTFSAEVRAQPNFVRARSVLSDVDQFDAGFFGMQPREAELVDPQHRILLECCFEALEHGGYDPATYPGAVGVYAGCSINTYALRNVLADRAAVEELTNEYQVGSYPVLLGTGHDFVATRIAYKLNLRGPAMTVQSACSTSLLAVAQACQTLLLGQADMMLAGAASITFPQKRGTLYQDGGMISSDGHCRTFDAQATGTVFGAGAGAVLLKRFADAEADGDTVYAVIRGFGVNNDGSSKAGYTAPSSAGQAQAIVAAQRMAGFEPRSIRFVECHGTATPLGDPIEFSALVNAFGVEPGGAPFCALGSVKTNIGHLDVAAGMSGLIKTALAIHHGKIPATLHFTAPNPRIRLAGSPFFVATELSDWPADDTRRRAGVSSFGVGGTNVHLVLEAPPVRAATLTPIAGPQLLVLSARSEAARAVMHKRLAAHLRATPDADLSAVAATLQTGRRRFAQRSSLCAATVSEAVEKLESGRMVVGKAPAMEPPIAFLFPGQGAQFDEMGRELYDRAPVFRTTFDRCAEIARPLLGVDLRTVLYRGIPAAEGLALDDTAFAQPALFAVEYALAQLWASCGIVPAAMIGHSVGEFVAATLAGVFDLEDALGLVVERGRLMQGLPGGAMVAVRLPDDELRALLPPVLALAAANSPKMSVAAGPFDAVEALERELGARGIPVRRLATSHAFHSPMMDPIVGPLHDRIARLTLAPPKLPYVSTLTGDWISDEEATSAEYWARHCREPVKFAAAITTLAAGDAAAFIEVGPGSALATFSRQTLEPAAIAALVGSLGAPDAQRGDLAHFLESVGHLWTCGVNVDWTGLPGRAHRRVPLPTYPFERTRHFIDAPISNRQRAAAPLEIPDVNESADASLTAPQSRIPGLQAELAALLEELSGESIGAGDVDTSFLELGFDSLFLGRFVTKLAARYHIDITFRALLGDVPTIAALAAFVDAALPPEARPAAAPAPAIPASTDTTGIPPSGASPVAPASTASAPPQSTSAPAPSFASSAADAGILAAVVREQLVAMQQLMRDQLAALSGPSAAAGPVPTTSASAPSAAAPTGLGAQTAAAAGVGAQSMAAAGAGAQPEAARPVAAAPPVDDSTPSRFAVYRPGNAVTRSEISPEVRAHIDELIARTVARTRESKARTQRDRAVLADPRVAAGFRSEWKEIVYPIVCERAKGSRIWDVDGNEYIDILNGFGQTAFGHSPDFVVSAVAAQLERGFPIGPQTPLAGEVAALFCELTGNERVTFCNTGSEAVMAAMRVARTVTGRDTVVVFNGAYHGQFDEVLVKGARTSQRALPVAPGIPKESVSNMVVLPYADDASLEWVRAHAGELAAVVVEPVQSRHPDLQPREFLTEVRAITAASGTAFIMDEVVTGFRMHPGGMQALFDIRADLATYGKVVGGGMPIGILAGKARFMDALDGGMWQYGDDSVPEVAPTFFAGTFVRHPLVMSAVLAVLQHLKAHGPGLQAELSGRTAELVSRLNAELTQRGLTSRIETFGSMFYINLSAEERFASLLYYHMRLRGIYVQEGFPCFLTTAHGSEEIDAVVRAFAASLDELRSVGLFGGSVSSAAPAFDAVTRAVPPTPDADTVFAPIGLTEEQTEIWLAAQLSDNASCAFNESITLRLSGKLDVAAFAGAWTHLLGRHDALRTAFNPTGESMRVAAPGEFAYRVEDLSSLAPAEAEDALRQFIDADAATAFDLVEGPLVRALLVRLSPDSNAFILTAHHIVCDGWSFNVLLTEFAQIYSALVAGARPQLDSAQQFSDYARVQARRDSAALAAVETFWLEQFREPVRPLDLPTDRPRPAIKTFRGGTYSTYIDAATYLAVKKAGARHGCTLFATLFTAFTALMGRLAGSSDVVVGVPAAGQALLENPTLVGHCVDFLPIRVRWDAPTTVADLLRSTKARVLDAYEHQDYTFGTLVRKLALERETNRLPLAEIQFNLERLADDLALPGLTLASTPNPKRFVNFDLFLNVIESSDGLRLDCDYNSDIFDQATIDRWLRYYRNWLAAIVADTSIPVGEVVFAPAGQANTTASFVAGPVREFPREATIASLFEAQVAVRPHAIAAICGDARMSYEMLDHRANALAHYLQARIGRPSALVGIAVERSLDMLVALLATMKAGYAYLPLDPAHPPTRLAHIIADADVAALVIDGLETPELVSEGGVPIVHLERDRESIAAGPHTAPLPATGAQELAYVIYTSGSTGLPKGVEVTHASVVNFLTTMRDAPGFTAGDILLAVTTISFDIAGLELFLPLSTGGTVVIATNEEARDGDALHARLRASGSTMLQATPATWRMLLEAGFRSTPGFKMLCGGEALRRDLADRLVAGDGELWNMYGPTETTIWSACGRIERDTPIGVGRPIANTQFAVLDAADRLVPVGTPGHLHIGGDGVARGYVKRPELTAERFIDNPFGSGRIYRTGDIARALPDGTFEVLGRIDDQIKLRGFRIELGEVETTLGRHPAVAAAAVALRPDRSDEPRLVGYYVERSNQRVSAAELAAFAAKSLPDYMVPTAWVGLDVLPLTANGKLDRGALPTPSAEPHETFAAPQSPMEIALAQIWANVFKREQIGTNDDIFALGADSIQIFQITARANRQGVPILAKHVMQHRTIGNIVKHLDDVGASDGRARRPLLRSDRPANGSS